MNPSALFVRRPVATILLAVALTVAGLFAYRQLPVAALPQVDFPTVSVTAQLPGASPETMANAVATPLIKQFSIIPAIQQIIQSARAAGLKIYGGTLVPFAGSNGTYKGDYGTAKGEQERQKLNTWIRTSGAFDGVIDFDKALRDPANPSRLLPAYDADKLHPNDAGYQAMANAVDLDAIIGAVVKGASP